MLYPCYANTNADAGADAKRMSPPQRYAIFKSPISCEDSNRMHNT